MIIVDQNGNEVDVYGEVIMKGNSIKYGQRELGTYADRKRVCEVFSQLCCHDWNGEEGVFVMPADTGSLADSNLIN